VSEPRQVVPGIWHWTARHEGIGLDVSSYYVEPARAVIDPMVPGTGLGWFSGREVERALLTNRHHYRHSDRFAAELGCSVHCPRPGLHEFEGTDRRVEGFGFGDEVAPGVTAHEVGAICPDESALHIRTASGALACADGVIRMGDGPLAFVPDDLLGDDPGAVKAGLRDAYGRLADLEFDALLLAHGAPVATNAESALRDFAGWTEG
jgi:hypothetical protein